MSFTVLHMMGILTFTAQSKATTAFASYGEDFVVTRDTSVASNNIS